MFWKGKVGLLRHLDGLLRQKDIALASELPIPAVSSSERLTTNYTVSRASLDDSEGIARLLREYFEPSNSKAKCSVAADWIRETFQMYDAVWSIAKDRGGTIRGCISSFRTVPPYDSAIGVVWGIVDWFCVHPLWRSKGVGRALLEALDYSTFTMGRKAHVFLKEGYPLPLPHIPVYVARLYCRRAGNPSIKVLPKADWIHPYRTMEASTGLPLVRVSPFHDWEKRLDSLLPPCIVFVSSGHDSLDARWKPDSLVSLYAFRWVAGKWFGTRPNTAIM